MTSEEVGPRSRLFVPWIIVAACCAVVMWVVPGEETVPYHVAWIGLASAYGIEAWPWRRTVYSVVAFTLVTGGILFERAATGVIAWGETAEIPLMSILVLLVLWNVRRRHVAYGELSRLAERDRLRAAQRERLSRMTSHEMRTPATIALGYADMLLRNETDERARSDLRVICDELRRLVLVGDRVIRMIRVHGEDEVRRHDLADLLRATGERWSVVAERNWVICCEPVQLLCSAERLRACLDTLVENALRYTEDGDTVRIFASRHGTSVRIGVADSGPGMDPLQLRAVNRGRLPAGDNDGGYLADDPKAQTGLGLALVHEAAQARGGRLVAGVSAEGGAMVMMVVPIEPGRPRAPGAAHDTGRDAMSASARHQAQKSVRSA